MAEEAVRAHVVIQGRVQGVWFRASTLDKAHNLGLDGWVRNRPDGAVEAVFEGPKKSVRQVVSWCHEGPRMAQVQDVEVDWSEPKGDISGFRVRS